MATIGSEVPQKETNSQKKNKSQLAKKLRVKEWTGSARADEKKYLATARSSFQDNKITT
ncbi:hypothetical protein RV15_GL002412 [Enterococcus silesiacus]|uniref:Uncharacterized protein n=1 Tax=Enterococcus silesiacus TaxID=332949 RepID=A0AA91JMT9_9ENTE|nr:hypothetical protein [Enterococcus silesiacus]OJG86227.1 hypothetical protein RV15_GL002412 [Enterococcus silesiacus]